MKNSTINHSVLLLCVLQVAGVLAGEPKGVDFETDTLRRVGARGDNWCITWAGDGSQIASMDDGNWLATGKTYHNRLYRIAGGPNDFQREELQHYPQMLGSGPAWFGYGILGIDRSLYSAVSLTPSKNWDGPFRGFMLLRSDDLGKHWQRVNAAGEPVPLSDHSEQGFGPEDEFQVSPERMFFFEESGREHDGEAAYPFSFCSFAQRGRGHEAADDGYVYIYSPEGAQSNELLLVRVKTDRLCERKQWQFFAGRDGGQTQWRSDLAKRQPVHVFPAKNDQGEHFGWYSWLPSVVWNPGLKLYIMANGGTYGGRKMTDSADDYYDAWMHTESGSLGFWYSKTPEGPWHRFFYDAKWTVDDPSN